MKFKIKKEVVLALIIFLHILLRIPTLFDPVSYGDECIYLTLGQAFNRGLVFYRDIHDNKPPLLYLVAALAGGKQVWFRVITIIWTSINVYLIYLLAKELFKKEWARLLSALLFVLLTLPAEGRIPNGEHFMIMPVTLAVLLLFKQKGWFWAGLAFSMAFLFKVPVGFDFVALWLAFFVFKAKTIKQALFNLTKKEVYLFTLGFILPIGLSLIYYASKGAFEPYLRSALMQNIGYLSSWAGGEKTSFLAKNQGLVIRGIILLLITTYLYWRRQKIGFKYTLIALWFSYGLFGALLSARPYPHYLMQLVPAASLLIAYTAQKVDWQKLAITEFMFFLTVVGYIYFKFWHYPIMPYYQAFLKYATGQTNQAQWFGYFGEKNKTDYAVSAYIKTHTTKDESIFVWGEGSCIYALSGRLPPGRYTVNYHIYDFNGYDETIRAINSKQPNIIVKLDSEKTVFPALEILLDQKYILAKKIGEANIYHRIFK